jgi:hypothetical protein
MCQNISLYSKIYTIMCQLKFLKTKRRIGGKIGPSGYLDGVAYLELISHLSLWKTSDETSDESWATISSSTSLPYSSCILRRKHSIDSENTLSESCDSRVC